MDGFIAQEIFLTHGTFIYKLTALLLVASCNAFVPVLILASCYKGMMSKFIKKDIIILITCVAILYFAALFSWQLLPVQT